jgi:antirestriction protein ArdC
MNEDRTRELLDKLAAGTQALASSQRWADYLAAQARFHRYSMGNVLLIMAQRPDATQVAGFKTWLTLDRHVRKGEKALWVLAPIAYKRTETDPETGQESERRGVRGFRAVPVFDVAQTDGADLPSPVTLLEGEDAGGAFEALAHVAKGWGWTVADAEADRLGAANGLTCHLTREVLISAQRSPAQRVKTLAHEIGHVLLHGEDCAYRADRGLVELEAESVAYVVCASLGIVSDDYSFGYVASWAGENAVSLIRASGDRIQRGVAQIIQGFDTTGALQPAA